MTEYIRKKAIILIREKTGADFFLSTERISNKRINQRGRCGGKKAENLQPPLEGVAEDRGAGWRQGKAFPQLSKYGLNHEDAYKKLLNSETYLRVSFLNLIHI